MNKVIIASLLGIALISSASANLLVNGGFATADGGWSFSSPSVSLADWGGGDVRSAGGSGVTSYWNDGAEGWGGNFSQIIAVDASTKYDISIWYEEDAGFNADSVYYNVEWADGSSSWGDKVETSITRPGGKTWTETTAQLTAPAYATQARVEIGYWKNTDEGALANSGIFDDASFVAVPEPVSAGLLGIGIGFIYLLRKKFTK